MESTVSLLGPVDELPAEGAEPDFAQERPLDRAASPFSQSRIGFALDREGIHPLFDAGTAPRFQRAAVDASGTEGNPMTWMDEAWEIDLDSLLSATDPYRHFSDAAEPEDYVRKFLHTLSSSLDEPALTGDGRCYPVVRWKGSENGEGATVQLLGLLVAGDDQFREFCESGDDDFGLIFEDAEVDAHGIREAALAMAVLGISMAFTPDADAGLFKKIKAKREARAAELSSEQVVRAVPAPVTQFTSQHSWMDVHQDAEIDFALLEAAGDEAERRIVVDIEDQRAYLLIDGKIAIDTAVSTAREGKHTPRGEFEITQRVREGKTSTIYGCALPFWMRLDQSAIGLHTGDLPGYPASAGCIRLPHSVAPVMFDNTASGITVQVMDSWDGPGAEGTDFLVADA